MVAKYFEALKKPM